MVGAFVLAAPQRDYAAPFEDKILPLKEQLGANKLGLEVLKTGRRIWLTVRMDPKENTISVDQFMKAKKRLSEVACGVYQNSQTEVLLERLD